MARCLQQLVFFCLLSLALPVAAHAAKLHDARMSVNSERTRLVFELTDKIRPEISVIDDPLRLVMDLPDTQQAVQLQEAIAESGLIKKIRSGRTDDNGVRVVLELTSRVKPRHFLIPPDGQHDNHRLVLDLYAFSKAQDDEESGSGKTQKSSSAHWQAESGSAWRLSRGIVRFSRSSTPGVATLNITPLLRRQGRDYVLATESSWRDLSRMMAFKKPAHDDVPDSSSTGKHESDQDLENSRVIACFRGDIAHLMDSKAYHLSPDAAQMYKSGAGFYQGSSAPAIRLVQKTVQEDRMVVDINPDQEAKQPTADESATALARASTSPVSSGQADNRRQLLGEWVKPGNAGQNIVIALDPGHGGQDPGAHGPGGITEKDVTLGIARRLKRMIDAQSNMQAVLTRTGDYYVGLRQRMAIARRYDADLFISLHADAAPMGVRASGSTVYTLSSRGATTEHARWLAQRENMPMAGGSSLKGQKSNLASLVLDMSQGTSVDASLDVGQRILDRLGRIGRLHRRTVQRAGFMVLKSPDIPSLLVETDFITNPLVSRRLMTAQHQDQLAMAILEGVKGYFSSYRPSVYVAANSKSGTSQTSKSRSSQSVNGRHHQVKEGETLFSIARNHGVSVERLREYNSLNDQSLHAGQQLRIPEPTQQIASS